MADHGMDWAVDPGGNTTLAGLSRPDDEVANATWRWAARALPAYLFAHSVRSYCWGAAIAAAEGLPFEPRILWPAALLHDVGLTRIPRARRCFEYEGAEIARRFVRRQGLSSAEADRVATAIVLHMAPSVSMADGVEAVLLDRATALDVRGIGADGIDPAIRASVAAAYPRGTFDRRFKAAIAREVAIRTDCQSARLLPRL